jgi:hypothetical protein
MMITVVGVCASVAMAEPTTLPALHVSDNGRFLVKADGTPFFWQGDTAWSIFNHPAPADVDVYLDDRQAKGFNVIQGVIALWDYTGHPNCDGELPFVNRDLGKINEKFYKNVDAVLDKVESRGMYMAMLPYWHKNAGDRLGVGDIPEKMKAYCKFLGQRYANKNVIWILGGDSTAEGEPGLKIQHVTDLEAQGLMEGAKAAGVDKLMISYHPTGQQSSSWWFDQSPWLDFNSLQSGHYIRNLNYDQVEADYELTPAKPVIDLEPGYENITDGLVPGTATAKRIGAWDVRRFAYLSVFAGAAGHTYGCGEVYEFWTPKSPRPRWGSGLEWHESLKLPGSGQMQFVRKLMESRPMLTRIPDQSVLMGETFETTQRIEATRSTDGSYAFIYTAAGRPVNVYLDKISGATISAWWYSPRDGTATKIKDFSRTDSASFTPPSSGEGNDWVLVLDDASKGFPAPGTEVK